MEYYHPSDKKAKYDLSDETIRSFGLKLEVSTMNSCLKDVYALLKRNVNNTFINSISQFLQKCCKDDDNIPMKYKVMRMKLVLLLHSFACEEDVCPVTQCVTMKETWLHITKCDITNCSDANCLSSRKLLQHWYSCEENKCILCYWCRRPGGLKEHSEKKFSDIVPTCNRKSRNIKEWMDEDLQDAFYPVLNRMFMYEKESAPFMRPVDPVADQCSDYLSIIRKPMDFGTICMKLENNHYSNPWQVVDDIYLVFGNCWLYNKKCSIYHKYACKLADVFESHIDVTMKKLGFCCGQRYEFTPLPKYCDSRMWCNIPVLSDYYSYNDQYSFCERCFAESPGCPTVSICKDPTSEPLIVEKKHFVAKRNLERKLERFVKCENCGRLNHVICVMYLENATTSPFLCHLCRSEVSLYKPVIYRAKDIPSNNLSDFIEARVKNFFLRKNIEAREVKVRVVASSKETTTVKSRFKKHFPQMAEEFPYVSKAIFAFQDIGDQDVCFFGMHVQEYGSDAPVPNSRRVYLAYLDSVQFFEPACYRTSLYHEILLAYMQYIKNLGYVSLHIWSCPPGEGDDYIFNCHPPKQKIPKAKRLQEWYKKLLEKATVENIVTNFTDILSYAISKDLKNAADMPYFDGDFWPNSLEDNIKDIEKNESLSDKSSSGKPSKPDKDPKSKNQKEKKITQSTHGDLLVDKIYSTLGKYREMFFVVEFSIGDLPPEIVDPDPIMPNDSMHERSSFLIMSRERQAEFSSQRRAVHSTLVMLHEILNPSKLLASSSSPSKSAASSYVCTGCNNKGDETYYVCKECQTWRFCSKCFEENGHPHETEAVSAKASDSGVDGLEHAATCKDERCKEPRCEKFKASFAHTAMCDNKLDCRCCRVLIRMIVIHARRCPINAADPSRQTDRAEDGKTCPVVFCKEAKAKLSEVMLKQRKIEERMLMRRTAAMMVVDDNDAEKQDHKVTDFQRMGSL